MELKPQPTFAVRVQLPMEGIDVGALIHQHLGPIMARMRNRGRSLAERLPADTTNGAASRRMELGFPVIRAIRATRARGRQIGRGRIVRIAGRAGRAGLAPRALDQMGATYSALHDWIHAQEREDGPGWWESYVDDPGKVPDPAQLRTEVYWPLG